MKENEMTEPRYRAAGVCAKAADDLIAAIKPLAAATDTQKNVIAGVGGFGALIAVPPGYREPVLVCGADGVGTKILLALQANKIDGLGVDLAAMCINDIITCGARPLFFADYYACGKLNGERAKTVIAGIARGCQAAGCALVGGETAEMPGMYKHGEFDLAGFAVGVVEKQDIITAAQVRPGDAIIGLASNGAHSNGFSLIRKILKDKNIALDAPFDNNNGDDSGGGTLADALLAPTRIYAAAVAKILEEEKPAIHGIAHITGGGLPGNLPRILPPGTEAMIDKTAWRRPPLFDFLAEAGGVSEAEMPAVFNCGIGMAIIAAPARADAITKIARACGETPFIIGQIRPSPASPAAAPPRVRLLG